MEDVSKLLDENNQETSQKEQDQVKIFKSHYFIHLAYFTIFPHDFNFSQNQILLQTYTYIQELPGKNIRSKLSIAFNYWMNIPIEKLKAIGEIVQMLHNSSLL